MSKEFTLSNFTYDGPNNTTTIPDDQVFEIYEVSYTSGPDGTLNSTATWAQLKNTHTIIVDDDIYKVYIKGIINNITHIYPLQVDVCGKLTDCFSFTFIAPINNPKVHIGLIRNNTYNFDIMWGDEGIGETGETINVGTLSPLFDDEDTCQHQYSILAGQSCTISICGECTRLTLRKVEVDDGIGLIGGMWYYDDFLHPTTPLPVVAINSWGNVNMTSFKRFAQRAVTLLTIPSTPIPHPTDYGVHDLETCFESMFEDCHKLTQLTNCNKLFSNFPEVVYYTRTFQNCYNIDLPFDIFSGCTSAVRFRNTFQNCYKLKPSRYANGKTYYEDRIYHHGDPGYPNPSNHNQEFADTYLNCNGEGAFPLPYWSLFPNHDTAIGGGYWGCYATKANFRNYTVTAIANKDTLNSYQKHHNGWFINLI